MTSSRGLVILYEDLNERWVRWAQEARLTTLGVHKIAPSGHHGALQSLLDALEAPGGRRIIDMLENAGIQVEYELHSLEWLLPRELISTQPDLFRMNEAGERTADNNFCPSSERAADIISERAYALAKRLRQTGHNYYLWPDDAVKAACHCPACRERNITGAELGMAFANAVARGLKAYDPKAMTAYIAYADAKQLPRVKPADNVFLEFAPMDRDHTKPMDDPAMPQGAEYIRLLRELLTMFPAGTTHVLEYWLDNALYSGFKKPPVKVPFHAHVAERDVALYTSFGIQNIKSFGSYIDGQYYQLHGDPPMAEYGDILAKYIPI